MTLNFGIACRRAALQTRSFDSRYLTGTSLQPRLMWKIFSNANDIYLFLMIFPRRDETPVQASSSPIPWIQIWPIIQNWVAVHCGESPKARNLPSFLE